MTPEPSAEERLLRELLWLNHGHSAGLYGDDGEMQCSECLLDFKRMPAKDIQARFQTRGLARLAKVCPCITTVPRPADFPHTPECPWR